MKHKTTNCLILKHAEIVVESEANLSHHGGANLWVNDNEWSSLTGEQKTWLVPKSQMKEWENLANLHRKVLDLLGLDTSCYPFGKMGEFLDGVI